MRLMHAGEPVLYLWLSVVCLIAGILGYFRDSEREFRWADMAKHLATCLFTGYIAFELLELIPSVKGHLHARVALSAVAAFGGEEVLISMTRRITGNGKS